MIFQCVHCWDNINKERKFVNLQSPLQLPRGFEYFAINNIYTKIRYFINMETDQCIRGFGNQNGPISSKIQALTRKLSLSVT